LWKILGKAGKILPSFAPCLLFFVRFSLLVSYFVTFYMHEYCPALTYKKFLLFDARQVNHTFLLLYVQNNVISMKIRIPSPSDDDAMFFKYHGNFASIHVRSRKFFIFSVIFVWKVDC